jgi:hypothetical protein
VVKKGYQKKHELFCKMALVPCSHSETCGEIIRKDLDEHLQEKCEYRPVYCELNCGTLMPFIRMASHLQSTCPNAEIECGQYCGTKLMRKELTEHVTLICPNSQLYCPLVDYQGTPCGTICLRKDLKEHQLTCNFRKVRCSNIGCKERILYKYLQDHEGMCKYKIINCPNGCESFFIRNELEKHNEECELEMVECSYKDIGCLFKTQRKNLQIHLEDYFKEHEQLMIKYVIKTNNHIKRLDNDLGDFLEKARSDIKSIKKALFLE